MPSSDSDIEPNPLDYVALNLLTLGDVGRMVMCGFIHLQQLNPAKAARTPPS